MRYRNKNEDDALQILDNLSLKNLDEKDRKIIMRMLINNDLETFADFEVKPFVGAMGESYLKTAVYTQNFLLLRELLQIRENNFEQNQQIIQQNQQIIEQNNKTVEQNQQIIDLLKEIKDK